MRIGDSATLELRVERPQCGDPAVERCLAKRGTLAIVVHVDQRASIASPDGGVDVGRSNE
jgi:hypothetical protein